MGGHLEGVFFVVVVEEDIDVGLGLFELLVPLGGESM